MADRVVLAALCLFCAACGPSAPAPAAAAESEAEKAAKALCKCTESLLAANKKALSSPSSTDFAKIAALFDEAKKCAQTINMGEKTLESLPQELPNHCPDLAKYPDLLYELCH